jgi:hypothetical protein
LTLSILPPAEGPNYPLELIDEPEAPLTPPSPFSHATIMDDFRRATIGPMREATSSMRSTIKQSLQTIEASRAVLARANDLARTIDDAAGVRRR